MNVNVYCADEHFQCENGFYITRNKVCIGFIECQETQADETNYYPPCDSSQFHCHNGQCIPLEQRCNGGPPDCFDRSDEINCSVPRLNESGQYIPQEFWCDYSRDCPDFSDETDCGMKYLPIEDCVECTG
ncbi:hypothetical protein DPMN_072547 [Dreissena polymorpha]|uniref:Uncharacterized protein n=1 Tax=Dreissena polymorpha TaxID=45954 RepID=A0A9D4BWV3_DREPO|nr:hypothetical protein DPMN_072547 [Dreissena polymorpha]